MKKPRNPVAEAAAYLTKPARHRDRKHDYERREKHRKSDSVGEEVDAKGKRRLREEWLPEGEDWYGDSEGQLDDFFWVESEEEPPTTGEVQ